jgi:predicted nucleic acid-binding protein
VADKCFFDSNVLLYLLEDDDLRSAKAKELVNAGGTVSVQVLNEFANVATKKFRMNSSAIVEVLLPIRDACEIAPLDLSIHDLAMAILNSTNLGVYDASIVAAAELTGCSVLYSEDMSHGQRIGGVTIVNPFLAV